jgi:hypothetical protein
MVVSVVPEAQDIRMVRAILELFAGTSGLHTNVNKCQFTPIQCSEEHIAMMHQWFPCQLVHFPCMQVFGCSPLRLQTQEG